MAGNLSFLLALQGLRLEPPVRGCGVIQKFDNSIKPREKNPWIARIDVR